MSTSNGQRLDGQGTECVRLEDDAHANLSLQVRQGKMKTGRQSKGHKKGGASKMQNWVE